MRFAQREYDLAELIQKASRQPAFEDGRIHLVTDLPKRGALIGTGDVERLGRALDQLFDNATKFTPEGGTVGVRARRLPNGMFEVCIADTGPGVPPEKEGRLFEPFYQVDGSPTRAFGGTGVGLAIVRGVARGHGGDVRLATPANEEIVGVRFNGAAVYLVIPERAGPASEPPSRPFDPAPPSRPL
jgi:signal transduction histidine kinase